MIEFLLVSTHYTESIKLITQRFLSHMCYQILIQIKIPYQINHIRITPHTMQKKLKFSIIKLRQNDVQGVVITLEGLNVTIQTHTNIHSY